MKKMTLKTLSLITLLTVLFTCVSFSITSGAVTEPAPTIVDLSQYLKDASNWNPDSTLLNGNLIVPNNWFACSYLINKTFKDELLQFDYKTTSMDDGAWPSFAMRYTGDPDKVVGDATNTTNNCYLIVVKKATIEIQKWINNVSTLMSTIPNNTKADGTGTPFIDKNVAYLMQVGVVDTAAGANIQMIVNNTKVVDYIDAAKSVDVAGKFLFYGVVNPVIIMPSIQTNANALKDQTIVDIRSYLQDKTKWNDDSDVTNGVLTVPTGWFSTSYLKTGSFKNEILQMNYKTEIKPGDWPSIQIRYSGGDPGEFIAGSTASTYLIVIKEKQIELQKFIAGVPSVLAILPNSSITSNSQNLIQVGAYDTTGGVNVVMNVNGTNVISYLDTVSPITTAGNFVLIGVEKPVIISSGNNANADELKNLNLVNINSLLTAQSSWNSDTPVISGVATVQPGWITPAFIQNPNFGRDDILQFNMQTVLKDGSWPAICIRYSGDDANTFIAGSKASCYLIVVKLNTIEIQKFVAGVGTVMCIIPNSGIIKSDTKQLIQVGAHDVTSGVDIVMNVDGKNVVSYIDTAKSIDTAGNFVFYGVDQAIMLSGVTVNTENPKTDDDSALPFALIIIAVVSLAIVLKVKKSELVR